MEQSLLQDLHPGVGWLGFEQALAELRGLCPPERVQRHVSVVQLARGQRKKGEAAAAFESGSHYRRLAGRVDDYKLRPRTRDQAPAKGPGFISVLPIVHSQPVLAQIDNQLHRAVRQNALLRVRNMVAVVIPQQVDEV